MNPIEPDRIRVVELSRPLIGYGFRREVFPGHTL